jgi:hypothetical protein
MTSLFFVQFLGTVVFFRSRARFFTDTNANIDINTTQLEIIANNQEISLQKLKREVYTTYINIETENIIK